MTNKRLIEVAGKIARGEDISVRTSKAFWREMDSVNLKRCAKIACRHHEALARGYQRSGHVGITPYIGRFGVGFKVLYPNNVSNRRSNTYHKIEYFIINY